MARDVAIIPSKEIINGVKKVPVDAAGGAFKLSMDHTMNFGWDFWLGMTKGFGRVKEKKYYVVPFSNVLSDPIRLPNVYI